MRGMDDLRGEEAGFNCSIGEPDRMQSTWVAWQKKKSLAIDSIGSSDQRCHNHLRHVFMIEGNFKGSPASADTYRLRPSSARRPYRLPGAWPEADWTSPGGDSSGLGRPPSYAGSLGGVGHAGPVQAGVRSGYKT